MMSDALVQLGDTKSLLSSTSFGIFKNIQVNAALLVAPAQNKVTIPCPMDSFTRSSTFIFRLLVSSCT